LTDFFPSFFTFPHFFDTKEKEKKNKEYDVKTESKTKCRLSHWRETQEKKRRVTFLSAFFDHFLPPDGFLSIQIQMAV
jgi:hypothetical protein